jgi:amino acid adenylation domain-containing protein
VSTDTFPVSHPTSAIDDVAGVPHAWAVGQSFEYRDAGLVELIWEQAIRRPDAIAVRQWDRTLSYGSLTAGARQVADALAAHGVRAESRVAVSVARRPAMVTALLGVLAAGGAYVPIDPDHPAERRDLILSDARVSVAVVDAAGRRSLAGTGMILIDVPDGITAAVAAAQPIAASGPDNTAYVLFTSGSTGRPKGVSIAVRSVVSFCGATAATCGVNQATRGIGFASLTFDVSVLDIFTVLLRGGCVCLASEDDRADPERLQRFLAHHEVTWGYLAPALLPLLDPAGLPTLRCVIVGGEATGPEQVERWTADGRTFLNWYGPTETTVSVTGVQLVGSWSSPLPIGRPLPNHRCYILDERLTPVRPGDAGELYVSGVGLAHGYLHDPGLTALRFLPDPFAGKPGERMYRTGDQVRWEPDGSLAFLGRLDGQIKVHGQRLEVGEVEAAVASHPSVVQAAVHLRRLRSGQTQLVAYVTPESAPDSDELRRYLGGRLPGYMVPSRFVRLDVLPLNSSSKVDFAALKSLVDAVGPGPGAGAAWPTSIHAGVADAWRDVLGEEPHPAAEFVGAGGDSLLAMRLAAVLRDRFGCSSSVADIFRAGTLGGLADAVAANSGSASVAAGPTTGSQPSLTPAQRRLWFIDRLSRQTPAYNVPVAVRLHGPLDRTALSAALADVAADHPVLRWRIPDRDGTPFVEVGAATLSELAVTDLTGTDALDRDVRDALRVVASSPFDLASGPLWRATLLRLGADEHVLAVTFHHAIFDGWSLSVFYRDLSRAYDRRLRSEAQAAQSAPTPPNAPRSPEVTFADYATWLNGADAIARRDDRDWWRSELAGVKPVLDLPTDRARPPVATFHGASAERLLPAPVAAAVRLFARDNNLTEYAVMLAAFGVLLARLTGEDDFLVGAPVADRRHPAFDDVIGFLVDTLPVRLRVDLKTDFTSYAKACHDAVLNAIAHRAVSFEALVDDLRAPRDLSRNPLIQVLFNMYSLVGVVPTLAGVTAQEMITEPPGSLFDVTMYVIERDDGLTLQAVYNPDLFDRDRMDAFIDSYVRLIDECLTAPCQPIGAVEARPVNAMAYVDREGATGPVLPTLEGPLEAAPEAVPLSAAIARICETYPDRVAIADNRHTLTYSDVSRIAEAIRHGILARGLGAGETVAVAATRTAELPAVLLGVLSSGARWLLLDPSAPAPRRAALMRAARPHLILECEGAETSAADGSGVPVVSTATLCREYAGRPALGVNDHLATDRGYFMATSGTTGESLIAHASEAPLARFLRWYVDEFAIGPSDVTALLGGITHDPLLRDAFTGLVAGARLCVPNDAWLRDPSTLAPWIGDQGVTILHLTPALGRLLCHAATPLPSVRLVVFAGDRLSASDVSAMRSIATHATIVNAYGTTETPQLQAMHVIGDMVSAASGAVPIGRGVNGNQLHVVNDLGAPATIGELGEVVVRGRNLATGYTDASLDPERFADNERTEDGGDRMFRTGDLGRYNARGEVVLAGRRDGQVKIRGFRVELGEIEAALASHPQVSAAAAAVHSIGGEPWLVAYAVPRRAGVLASALREHVGGLVPDYACPVEVLLLPEIPLTRNGKVDRAALPPPATVRPESGHAEATTPTERQISLVWRQVLRLPRISVTANFFEIGGNSLAIVAVQARLLSDLGRRVELVDLFRFPNVRALAAHIDGGKRSPGLDRAARRLAAQRRHVPSQPAGPRSLPTE